MVAEQRDGDAQCELGVVYARGLGAAPADQGPPQKHLSKSRDEVMTVFRRIAKWVGVVCGVLVLFVIAQIGWGMYREPIAKKQAEDFCATIKIGQSPDGIAERASASDSEAKPSKWNTGADGIRELPVIYIGTPPFSRHICFIKATSTTVISAEYEYMD